MTTLIIFLSLILLIVIMVQIGKVTELAGSIRGKELTERESNNFNGRALMAFMILFLIGVVWSSIYYKDAILWYGPHIAASEHGGELDSMFNWTLFLTGIIFFITQILLFWFAYKYRKTNHPKAIFISHDNKLEVIWTVIPAVVMAFLVIRGLVGWNEVMADVGEDEDFIEIEATGYQFAWAMRYPGKDGALGTRDFRKITTKNILGLDWEDPKSLDDIVSSAPGDIIKLPIGKKVRARITARDVLHDFDIPHMRVKMDAVPGMPTYFVFTPNITTEDYRKRLGALDPVTEEPLYPEWHEPIDPDDPESEPRWKAFHFEMACAELCGKGHYSMKRIVEVVSEEEWKTWKDGLESTYLTSIRNTDEDPYKGKLLNSDIASRKAEFDDKLAKALEEKDAEKKIVRLDYVTFRTGSAELTPLSRYEIGNVVEAMKANDKLEIELGGHTDNTGNPESNLSLSQSRAEAVYKALIGGGIEEDRLKAVGYGQNRPIADNETPEGRQENRRTEFKITAQ